MLCVIVFKLAYNHYYIQTSKRRSRSFCIKNAKKTDDIKNRLLYRKKSGYRDSNPGPPTPEAGALTGLRYIPNILVVRADAVIPSPTTSKKKGRIATTSVFCRDTRIRTWDPLLPKQVR